MTIYETIKAAISVKRAAEHYGLKVHRNGMACCTGLCAVAFGVLYPQRRTYGKRNERGRWRF